VKIWVSMLVLFISSLPAAFADSITYTVDAQGVRLMQGVTQTLTVGHGALPFLDILAGAGPGPYLMTMSWTLSLPNQAGQVLNFSGNCYAGDTCLWDDGFFVPTSFTPVPFTLTIQFNIGSSPVTETFKEYYVSSVPEPSSFLYIVTGIAAAAGLKSRRKP
jgi:hypothetical protein